MIGFLQRVAHAGVAVDGEPIAAIERGLLVLVAAQRDDTRREAERLLQRLLAYRVFADDQQRMNRSLTDIGGDLLLVPQFTLAADTRHGNRPGFSHAAAPQHARALLEYLHQRAVAAHAGAVAVGRFGADMQVSLVNDGPVSFWLEVPPATAGAGSDT